VKVLAKTYISANLRGIETLYNSATSPRKSLFYSKLAILELCGWIEVSMDRMVECSASRNLKNRVNIVGVGSRIKRTYGFDYERHFRELVVSVIGLKSVEKVERSLDVTKFSRLTAALTALKTNRDNQAHTYIKGTTLILDAPSLTRTRFEDVYEGLSNFDNTMRKLGF